MNQKPFISVLLPVYNAEKYLAESIQSILNQTYTHFELLILNDGSTDRSEEIALSFKDERILYVKHANCGLATTLNKGLALAKGDYIARQDNDDISLPERFEKQLAFISSHPNTVLLGTAAEIIDEAGHTSDRYHQHPINNIELKWALLFNNPFVHSSVMFNKEKAMACGAYSVDASYFEDYHLWSRLAQIGELANLSECLLKYREVNSGMSKSTQDYTQRVKNQSLLNISSYCPTLQQQDVQVFVDSNFGDVEKHELKRVKKIHAHVLKNLAQAFCKREKLEMNQISEALLRQKIHMRRHSLNHIIQSETASFFIRFKAKVLRKILFTLYRKYL
ncbi:MAG: glycosyltransferase [Bacteroidota bacterium]